MSPKFKPDNTLAVANAIRRVLAGDVEAYEVVYVACDSSLRAFIGRHYAWAGPDFVEEVAVRSHERALARLHAYNQDRGASFLTWLCWQSRSVASAVVREWYGPRLVSYDESVHGTWAVTQSGPAEVYEDERRSRVVREELESLPEEGRQSVVLHDRDGLTFAETAKAAGTTVWKTRRRRAQALAVLKRRLQERGVRPVEVDFTPPPVYHGWDRTEPDDDWCATVGAVLPDGPDTLHGADAKEEPEVPEE
jgi:RNA polymerase sigma factor (sigma-70 family)